MKQRYVVVDIETTGNSPRKGDRIIQFASVVIENEKIVDQYSTFVNPRIKIPVFIEELTGINDSMVVDAPVFEEIAGNLVNLLDNSVFVAHNVLFDLNFLQNEFERVGFPHFNGANFDTVELAKILLPTSDSYKLIELAESFSLSHDRPHQADSDAMVTAELLLQLIKIAKELPLITLEKLTSFSVFLKSDLKQLFDHILTDKKAHLENLSQNLEVYRGIAVRKKSSSQINQDYRAIEQYPISIDEKEKLLSSSISNFEKRNGQFEMMDTVYEAFHLKKLAMIEAGTGVGKSLGYLLPSIYFALHHHQSILISTYTIQLQDQLLQKEIKTLAQLVPFPFKTVLLKGRQHYLNMFKFEQSLLEIDSQYDSVLTKMQILVWLTTTTIGDVDELNLSSGGKLFWNRIKNDGWHLPINKDPWISRDFYLHARKQAEDATIIITNHAMLLSDLAQEGKLFQDFDYLIIDEAHHLEKASRHCFGHKLEYIPNKFLCSKLGTFDKKQLFYRLEQLLGAKQLDAGLHRFELDFLIIELERDLDELFLMIGDKLIHQRNNKMLQKIQIRLSKDWMNENKWHSIQLCAERLLTNAKEMIAGILERLEHLKKISDQLSENEKAFLEEAYSFVRDWEIFEQTIRFILIEQPKGFVYWIDGDLRAIPNSITVYAQPITVQQQLANDLFAKKKSVVLTSATLTVNQSFAFFQNELGLNSFEKIIQKQIPSPFQYKDSTKLIIPNDIPEIRQVSSYEYAEAITGHLIAIAQATKGRMLVLFTSYELLKITFDLMKDSGSLEDFMLIAQGVSAGSRTRLTKNFQRFEKSILLGTNSFWEGVDIPGEDLSCLVMVRLPFSPPYEPITEAKSEMIKAQGKNAFSTYSLPEAVIRFKQGFGRLIRRSSDKGIVIVFDRRIETTSYGNAFIRSIPPIPIEHVPLKRIIEIVEEWL